MDRIEPFDSLIESLKKDGLNREALSIHFVIHQFVCATNTEFYGKLGQELKAIKRRSGTRFSPLTAKLFAMSAEPVNKAWPGIIP